MGIRYNQRIFTAHLVAHIIPVAYFVLTWLRATPSSLDPVFVLPIMVFFVTGVRCWRHFYQLFGRKLYRVFQLGNTQMLIYFPIMFALDLLGWPSDHAPYFSRLMAVYFALHFLFATFTIPLMLNDVKRLARQES